MSTVTRVRPDDLTIVPATSVDRAVIDEMIGEHRTQLMAENGMAMADRATMPIEGLLAAVEAGICRSWVAYYDDRPAAFLMYAPFSLPGVWSGEVITHPAVTDLRGAGTSAMARALDLMFDEPGVRLMIGFVSVRNATAIALVDKLGYLRMNPCDRLLQAPDGAELDAWMVSMHRDSWAGSGAWHAGLATPGHA